MRAAVLRALRLARKVSPGLTLLAGFAAGTLFAANASGKGDALPAAAAGLLVGAALGRWFSARRQVATAVATAVAAANATADARQLVVVSTGRGPSGELLLDHVGTGELVTSSERVGELVRSGADPWSVDHDAAMDDAVGRALAYGRPELRSPE